jgi:hypothetical protein
MTLRLTILLSAVLAVALALLPSCGRSPFDEGPDTAGGQGARGGQIARGDASAETALCALEPQGQFTFHVHNNTGAVLFWSTVCGRGLPIVLDTARGTLPIAPIGLCGVTCDDVYTRGVDPDACTDCGPGTKSSVQPGASSDIEWDRRVYAPHVYSSACGPVRFVGQSCEEGHALAPNATQTGKIRVCNSQGDPGCIGGRDVTFTIDTTKAAGTIEIN